MHFTKKNSSEKRIELKNKLKKQKILKFPGAYNPLTAKLISEIGFEGIYISGGVMANDLGIPDIGLTTLKEVSYRANQISRVTDLPSIVDADTGFGDCKKTVETFEQLGLSGCHIEDQIDEKRCGHLDNKEIIPLTKMINKIKTAVNAKKDKNFLIIARTDANSVEGIKKTIDRAKAYEDAGADIIFPEAMKDEKETGRPLKFYEAALFQFINPKAWVVALTAATAFFPSEENFFIATAFVAVTAPFICLPSICLWALFGSSIKLIIKNTRIKKIIEYLLALLLVVTAVLIVIN